MTKKVKTFQVVLSDPCKSFYCGGERVCGRVEVEVTEVLRVNAVKILALGRAKVEYAKGKQRCRQEAEYLRHEEVLKLSEQPTGRYILSASGPTSALVPTQRTYSLSFQTLMDPCC